MSQKKNFFLDGYTKISVSNSDSTSDILGVLERIECDQLKENFSLIKKYNGTDDLRPSAHEYDDVFMRFIFDNDLNKKINLLTGKDMVLYHVQVRRFFKGSSYMPWHRDSYLIDDRAIGNIPPAYKMIFYPKFSENSTKRLTFLRGSHNMFPPPSKSSDFISPGFSKFDSQLFNILNEEEIHADSENILLFNTSILHNVINNEDDRPNTRLIYSFLERDQISSDMMIHPHEKIISNFLKYNKV
jgi:hypothetical protein